MTGPVVGPTVDIRATYTRFPGWTQHFWTWMTGKALPGQRPRIRHSWRSYLVVTCGLFALGLLLAGAAVTHRFPLWPAGLAAGWVASLAAARAMILVIVHQCIHRRFSGDARRDRMIAEALTALTLWQDAARMKGEHFDAHHDEAFATHADPPVQSLLKLGFRPGLARTELWRRALVVFVSPRFYMSWFVDRLRWNATAAPARRVAFVLWVGVLVVAAVRLDHGPIVVGLAFVLPVVLLAQLCALLDRLGEHAWLTPPDPRYGVRRQHIPATWARFCGRAVPPSGLPLRACVTGWARWLLGTVLVDVPSRLLVLPGDLPNHDFHHRNPGTWDWAIAAYRRQGEIDEAGPDDAPYTEVWGLKAAIDRMLVGLSEAEVVAAARG